MKVGDLVTYVGIPCIVVELKPDDRVIVMFGSGARENVCRSRLEEARGRRYLVD